MGEQQSKIEVCWRSKTYVRRRTPVINKDSFPRQSQKTAHFRPRPDYEQMVKIFQPLIVENVLVRRLLPHLPFLSNTDRLRAIQERDPHAAVIYLIDELCSNNNTEPGRWGQFIQALETCGYNNIVATLRGQDPLDDTCQRGYLRIFTPALREQIDPLELLPELWGRDVLSNEDREEILQLQRNRGPLAATDELLDLVPRRHKSWYRHLVDALRNVGRTEAADILARLEIQDYNVKGNLNKGPRATPRQQTPENVSPLPRRKETPYHDYTNVPGNGSRAIPLQQAPENVLPLPPRKKALYHDFTIGPGNGLSKYKPPVPTPRCYTKPTLEEGECKGQNQSKLTIDSYAMDRTGKREKNDGAMAAETSPLGGDNLVPYSSMDDSTGRDTPKELYQQYENKSISKYCDIPETDEERAKASNPSAVEVNKGQIEEIDKDSDFYSE